MREGQEVEQDGHRHQMPENEGMDLVAEKGQNGQHVVEGYPDPKDQALAFDELVESL